MRLVDGVVPLVRSAEMDQGELLKAVFRNGWSHAGRVKGWKGISVEGEFGNTASRATWLAALASAVQGMGPRNGLEAVDMGNGPGTIAQLWAELGLKTRGLDFSSTMIAAAREGTKARGLEIEFFEGDVEKPPFEAGTCDVISSRLVLFTLPHPGLAINRWKKMLRPGGRIVLIGEDHGEKKRHGENRPQRPERPRSPDSWHADETYKATLDQLPFMWHTERDLHVVLEAAGFEGVASLPTADIAAAREVLIRDHPETRTFRSRPFVVVGRQPV